MDTLQLVLIIVLLVLTCVIVVIGVYLALVLKDFRETVKKANEVLDDTRQITGALSSPLTTVIGVVAGLTESLKAVKSVKGLFANSKKGGK